MLNSTQAKLHAACVLVRLAGSYCCRPIPLGVPVGTYEKYERTAAWYASVYFPFRVLSAGLIAC